MHRASSLNVPTGRSENQQEVNEMAFTALAPALRTSARGSNSNNSNNSGGRKRKPCRKMPNPRRCRRRRRSNS
jgi:hypothetical protein